MEKNLTNLTHEEKIKSLISFLRENELREELGWFEHTSDWDPFLLIQTKDEIIETSTGYSEIEIINYKANNTIYTEAHLIQEIRVTVDKDDESIDTESLRINIDDIQTIRWRAH